jgi:hypothetical protein
VIIVHTPEGGEEERYDARKLLTSEAAVVARTLGMKWPAVKEALGEDDPEAMRAVAWVMKKRAEPTLRFSDFDPGIDEIVSRYDDREIADYVTEAVKVKAPEDERQTFFRVLVHNAADPAHAEALIKEHTGGGPKEPTDETPTSASSEASTSGSSPIFSTSDPVTSTV